MRHQKIRLQLNRFTSWRRATLIGLAKSLLRYQRIRTTITRAKAARPLAEKLITLAKLNTLSAKRRAYQILGEHKLVSTLFNEIGPLFKNRVGGYTRILRIGLRRGDDAQMVFLELTQIQARPKRVKKIKEGQTQGIKTEAEHRPESQEKITPARKPVTETAVKEKPPVTVKPPKKFLGGIRNIFKKERDSL